MKLKLILEDKLRKTVKLIPEDDFEKETLALFNTRSEFDVDISTVNKSAMYNDDTVHALDINLTEVRERQTVQTWDRELKQAVEIIRELRANCRNNTKREVMSRSFDFMDELKRYGLIEDI